MQTGHLCHAIRYPSGPWSGWGRRRHGRRDIGNVRRAAVTTFGGEAESIATNRRREVRHHPGHLIRGSQFKIPGPPSEHLGHRPRRSGVADLLHAVSDRDVTGIITTPGPDIAELVAGGQCQCGDWWFHSRPWALGTSSGSATELTLGDSPNKLGLSDIRGPSTRAPSDCPQNAPVFTASPSQGPARVHRGEGDDSREAPAAPAEADRVNASATRRYATAMLGPSRPSFVSRSRPG